MHAKPDLRVEFSSCVISGSGSVIAAVIRLKKGLDIQFRLRTLFVGLTLFCVLMAVVAFGASLLRKVLAAEEAYQTFFRAYNPTITFVESNNGDWPSSWDDLAALQPGIDYEWVAQHIEYDFNANPKDLAESTPETFDAIQNKSQYYDFTIEIQTLIDTLREFHK